MLEKVFDALGLQGNTIKMSPRPHLTPGRTGGTRKRVAPAAGEDAENANLDGHCQALSGTLQPHPMRFPHSYSSSSSSRPYPRFFLTYHCLSQIQLSLKPPDPNISPTFPSWLLYPYLKKIQCCPNTQSLFSSSILPSYSQS